MVEAHLDNPGVRIVFAMPHGPALEREWTWRQVFTHEVPDWLFRSSPPWWLEDGETEWHDPLCPIEYRGRVKRGQEETARDWVFRDYHT